MATDDRGATKTSSPITIALMPPAGRTNVALASNGGTATASTAFSGGFPASSVINGDRKGLSWGSGGGWQDGTDGVWPDWLEVQFSGPQTIEEIDVFTVQDSLHRTERANDRHDVYEVWTAGLRRGVLDRKRVGGGARRERVEQHPRVASVQFRAGDDVTYSSMGHAGAGGRAAVWSRSKRTRCGARSTRRPRSPSSPARRDVPGIDVSLSRGDGDGRRWHREPGQVLRQRRYRGHGYDRVAGVFTTMWTPSIAGTYTVTAEATDDRGGVKTSESHLGRLVPPAGRTNVALASQRWIRRGLDAPSARHFPPAV